MKAPLDLPVRGASRQTFELQRVDYSAPEAGGRIGGVQAGFPLWVSVLTLTDMTPDKSDEWRTMMDQVRGASRRVLVYDRKRPYPKLYPAGFSDFAPFDGTAADWSETIDVNGDSQLTLELGADAAGLELSLGDYVGFRWTATETSVFDLTWRTVARVVVGGTADGSGDVTVTVEPPLPTCVPDDATAHLDYPKCIMALVTDQTKLESFDRRGAIRGGTLVAVQDLRS